MRERVAVCTLLIASILPITALADSEGRTFAARDPMPGPFSYTTGSAALRALFPSYVAATGTVTSPRTKQGHPAHVVLVDAKPWYADGLPYLVVVVEREEAEHEFELAQCGACWRPITIAVLRRSQGALAVVARTNAGRSNTRDGIFEELSVKGDGDGRLDLAPYRVTAHETLLGWRSEVDAMGTSGTIESMLRIVGGALVPVADIPIGDSSWVGSLRYERTSTIAVVPSSGKYDSLRVTSTTYRCSVSSDVRCSRSGSKHVISVHSTTYCFDGTAYHKRDASCGTASSTR